MTSEFVDYFMYVFSSIGWLVYYWARQNKKEIIDQIVLEMIAEYTEVEENKEIWTM